MPVAIRILTLAGIVTAIAAHAQFVIPAPMRIGFVASGYTLMSAEEAPGQFVELAPNPAGIDSVPFHIREIRLTTLPTGVATNFVTVSPASGTARAAIVIALNPKVVPYMRPGFYSLDVVIDNPQRPAQIPSAVIVTLR